MDPTSIKRRPRVSTAASLPAPDAATRERMLRHLVTLGAARTAKAPALDGPAAASRLRARIEHKIARRDAG